VAEEKRASIWKVGGMTLKGCVLATMGKGAEAAQALTSALGAWRSTGATIFAPIMLSYLALAHFSLHNFSEASRCIDEAMSTVKQTKEAFWAAEAIRISGQIQLNAPQPNAQKAEERFAQALALARQQQAKSWELRAAMSMARLWRDQGKVQKARELLAPVYGWFTEGFDTRDLKEAKALLEGLQT
jgi:predicted ATPase